MPVIGIQNLAIVLWAPSKATMNIDDKLEVELEERELLYLQDPKRLIAIGFPLFYIVLGSITATLGYLNYF